MYIGALQVESGSPLVMGILNVTPDSFSDGGHLFHDSHLDLDLVLKRTEQMIDDGAAIIDVGGESTRPGAKPVTIQQELDRVIPAIEAIRSRFDIPISVDTSSPQVITESALAGVALINDVRALQRNGALGAVAKTNLPVCLMHMQGEPGSMQNKPGYIDVVSEVEDFLAERIRTCEAAGISADRLLLDPGFGFGKTLEHNLALFNRLPELVSKGFPVLIGVSRKAMVGAILEREHLKTRGTGDRMVGSVALALIAAQRGVAILRVHDVAATVDALKVLSAL